ncbi:hypothetical protein EDD86DRAFT_197005 [Gorgonomyces haynaldii]|nr:hypothetical protein EDD86DRAFT_197005 [Gorgonomyces haynaldii]
MFSLVFPAAVLAQTPCFSLQASTTCPDLAQYSVIRFASVTDAASFDTFMNSQIVDSSPTAISTFQQNYQCPTYAGHNTRFRLSTLCYFFVTQSLDKCTPPAAPLVPLCKSTCNSYLSSVQQTFANATVCDQNPGATQAANRASVSSVGGAQTSLGDFCASLFDVAAPQCSTGIKTDFAQCGFAFAGDADAYCAVNTQDPCCVAKASASAPMTLDPINNVWVIFGIVAGGLVVLGLIFYGVSKFFRKGNQAFQPDRESKAKSFFKKFSMYKDVDQQKRSTKMDMPTKPRSSLFTTIRASTMFGNNDPAPPLPGGKTNSNPFVSGVPSLDAPRGNDPQRKVQVFEDYEAGMDDEMTVKVGDVVIVNEEYDDGWAFGVNISSGREGVFPMAVCEPLGAGANNRPYSGRQSVMSARTQSLIANFR